MSLTPPPNFLAGERAKVDFRPRLPLSCSGSKTGQHIGNLTHAAGAQIIAAYTDRDISLIFTGGQNSAKFGLSFPFKGVWYCVIMGPERSRRGFQSRRLESAYHKIQGGGRTPNFQSLNRYNSVADCSIALISGTEHYSGYITNVQSQRVKGQDHNVT